MRQLKDKTDYHTRLLRNQIYQFMKDKFDLKIKKVRDPNHESNKGTFFNKYYNEIYLELSKDIFNTYTHCEIFINLAEFYNKDIKTLLDLLDDDYKIKIIKELKK
jgi:hypothetical protein